MSFVYVLWAVQDDLVKIGFSQSPRNRVSTHSGNSSNPLEFETWKTYRFENSNIARNVERRAKDELRRLGVAYRNKEELFNCSPTVVTNAIELVCQAEKIRTLKNIPLTPTETLQTFSDFPCLPDYGHDLLSAEQRMFYWKGVQDVFWLLSYFDGARILRPDMMALWRNTKETEDRELTTLMIDFFRNYEAAFSTKEHSETVRKIAWDALERLKSDRRQAYEAWQEIDE